MGLLEGVISFDEEQVTSNSIGLAKGIINLLGHDKNFAGSGLHQSILGAWMREYAGYISKSDSRVLTVADIGITSYYCWPEEYPWPQAHGLIVPKFLPQLTNENPFPQLSGLVNAVSLALVAMGYGDETSPRHRLKEFTKAFNSHGRLLMNSLREEKLL